MKKKRIIKKGLEILAVTLFWLTLWFLASLITGQDLLLPSPLSVGKRLLELARQPSFYYVSGMSLLRVFGAIVAAIPVALLVAILSSTVKPIDKLLSPAITVIKSTPVASFIILALVWIGREILPSFIAFLMVFPVVFTNVREGIYHTPSDQLIMAKVFSLPLHLKIKRIYIPSVLPYFLSSVQTSIGLAWKAGIAAEVLAFSPNSIGKFLAESKNYLETTDLFAWTAVIIILSLFIEIVMVKSISAISARRKRRSTV